MYQLEADPSKDGSGAPSKKIKMKEVGEVKSSGATDMEHFTIGGHHFLAISNEGDIQKQHHQISRIYYMSPEDDSREEL